MTFHSMDSIDDVVGNVIGNAHDHSRDHKSTSIHNEDKSSFLFETSSSCIDLDKPNL
jgi:hypothetical protein